MLTVLAGVSVGYSGCIWLALPSLAYEGYKYEHQPSSGSPADTSGSPADTSGSPADTNGTSSNPDSSSRDNTFSSHSIE
jgi:hypothetical protein